ncbi:hypothetical protein LGQ02_12575 [Bacillus shivajii]|uniref:hypothetical protein n=1 Tax=Bacillus shivajii TaxID=1983719 RepID=UPI001CFA5B56|nr:hypothetical protein [Bacillus shivajii]UCZ51699.1 hypothetical protein LGQ02_12575 [Bacillus shivajii]
MGGVKSLGLQVALPRTQTAGKIQEQLQNRSQVAQEHISKAQKEEEIKKQKAVTESNPSEDKNLNNDEEGREGKRGHQYEPSEGKWTEEEKEQDIHPYKGKNFDASW